MKKARAKILVDLALTVVLLLLMTFEMIGAAAHEWLGIGMFFLVIVHHILNWKWSKNLFRDRYTAYRIAQTVLVFLVLLTILGAAYSGAVLSRHALRFLDIPDRRSTARTLHLLCSYWGYVLMGLHLGLHWNRMLGIVRKHFADKKSHTTVLRIIGWVIAAYGVYAFFKRDIGEYMLLKKQFVFFDFEEPLVFFVVDYLAVMGLWVLVGYYLSSVIRNGKNRRAS